MASLSRCKATAATIAGLSCSGPSGAVSSAASISADVTAIRVCSDVNPLRGGVSQFEI